MCVSLMDMGVHQSKGGLLRYEFAPYFRPHTQQPGGLIEVPRRWQRVKRIFAWGEQEIQGFLKNSGTDPGLSSRIPKFFGRVFLPRNSTSWDGSEFNLSLRLCTFASLRLSLLNSQRSLREVRICRTAWGKKAKRRRKGNTEAQRAQRRVAQRREAQRREKRRTDSEARAAPSGLVVHPKGPRGRPSEGVAAGPPGEELLRDQEGRPGSE